jgi:hypothetical protein
MKFSVGYQVNKTNSFIEYIAQNKEHIYEMYFSWGDIPNGRNSMLLNENLLPWQAQQKQIEDLMFISQNKIALNLLLNANCYGENSQSRNFYITIGNTIDYIASTFGLKSITTTSPLIGKFIHENFEDIEVRASVNMKIGSPIAMEYVSEYFDSYYMQREYNRNLKNIKEIKAWCDKNNKGLYMLANSGCLNDCSAHTFHDNLVAHEADIAKMDNAYNFEGICKKHLEKNRLSVIKDTNFVRPEDIHLYDEYFIAAKLATRVSNNPIKTLRAYINGKYFGAITDILEPNHSSIFYPDIIENSKFPNNFATTVMTCNKNCDQCNFCKQCLENSTITLENLD